MPDVGVLNLTIQENSQNAVQGLDNLVGALSRVRDIVNGGLKLSSVATGLKRLAQAVNENLTGTTIVKIRNLANELQKLQGLGNLNIRISGGSSVQSIVDSLNEARDAMSAINTGFDTFGERAAESTAGINGFNGTVRETEQLMQSTAWTYGVDQFRAMFEEFSKLRSMASLPAGEQTQLSTEVEKGWSLWKEGAIEVEGTVTDAMDNVARRLGEPIKYLTSTSSQLGSMNDYIKQSNGLMEELAKKTSAVSGSMNAIIPYTGKSGFEQFLEGMKPVGYGTGGIAGLLNEKTPFSNALRGLEGAKAQLEAINQVAKILGLNVNDVAAQLKELGVTFGTEAGKVSSATSTMVKGANEVRDALTSKGDLNGFVNIDQFVEAYSHVEYLKQKIEELKATLEHKIRMKLINPDEIDAAVQRIRRLQQEYDKLTAPVEEAAESVNYFSAALGGLKKMFPGVFGLFKQFKNMAKRMALRALIRAITAGVKEGVENVYHYSKIVGTSFAPAMDAAATSLQQMKNSIGAMLAPALQALIPILQTVINYFVTAMNAVNQFFALINGQQTWTRALPESAEAFDNTAKNAKKASKATKDLLADWDELNIIKSQDSGSAGTIGGHTAEEYKNMFEEVSKYNENIKALVNNINDQFGDTWNFVKKIGAGILLWKATEAFTGVLGTLAGLGGSVIAMDLVFNISSVFTKNFLQTGNTGWLVGDLLTTLLGGVLARKMLTKVLGGGLAKLAIPLTFSISAVADIVALVQDTDVTALSEKGVLSAVNTALKGGVAAGALYSLVGYNALTSAVAGLGTAIFTFGATVGIKAIAETVDAGAITGDIIKEDLVSAGTIGAGLAISEAILGGTIGTIVLAGAGGAVATFGVLIALELLLSKQENNVKWGDYEATEKEIRAFVENEVFTVNPQTILNIMDPVITVANENGEALTATVDEVKLTVKKLAFDLNDESTLKELEEQIFGNSDTGTKGLIGQFKETARNKQTVIETGMLLMPTSQTDNGEVKQIIDESSEGWKMLTGHMDYLGRELSKHMAEAYKEDISDEARSMELRTIQELTGMMTRVSTAITQGEAEEKALRALEENISGLTQGSWDMMFDYIDEYQRSVTSAYTQAYDAVTDAMAGEVAGLKASMDNALELAGGNENDSQYKAYKDEYERMKKLLDARREGRADAIEGYKETAMNDETVARIKKALGTIIDQTAIDVSDVRALGLENIVGGPEFLNTLWSVLFDENGVDRGNAKEQVSGWLDQLIDAAFGSDAETIKKAINSGMINYGDVIQKDVIDSLAETIGITKSPKLVNAWNKMMGELYGWYTPIETTLEAPAIDYKQFDSNLQIMKKLAKETVTDIKNNIESLNGITVELKAYGYYDYDTSGGRRGGGGVKNGHLRVEDIYASGGFPKSGDLFMGNENGRIEMMGSMGTKPVVANNQQIVDGISQGVSTANEGVESRLSAIEALLTKVLNKEFVARAVPSTGWGQHNAASQRAYDKVTG